MSEEEDEDWFERALRELDEERAGSTRPTEEERTTRDEETGTEAGDGSREGDGPDVPSGSSEQDPDTVSQEPLDDSGARNTGQESFRSDTFGGDDPFGGAVDDATGEDGDDDSFGGGSFGEDDPFGGGGGGGGDDSFGSGSFGEDDPFGGGGGGGDDPFGGGSFGADDPFGGSVSPDPDTPTGFDEDAAAEFDSEINRTDIGIAGLDEMILGGVPSRSLLSVIGGAGTGKTTFALQFLQEALESGDRGVYITLDQTRESILSTAEEKGWPFREHADAGQLAVVALDPIEMANSLASIRNDLARLIESFDADRLVLDSVSLLEMMYDHPAKRRSEVFGFTRSLKEAGVTTLLTSEASDETPYSSRYGIVEYLTDGVFVLQYVRGSDFRETRLAVEIQKIRDSNHSRETKPYEITNAGISVYRQANIF